MATPERAFTLQLMRESEVQNETINSLVALCQLQYTMAALEGHPFPISPLEGQVPTEHLQLMINTMQARVTGLQKLHEAQHNGKVINIAGKASEHDEPSANGNGQAEGLPVVLGVDGPLGEES